MSEIHGLQDYNNLCFAGSHQQTNNLMDDPNLASAIKKMVELQLPIMVFPIVKRILDSLLGSLEPMMENLVRKVVEEQLERAQEMFFTREKWKSGDETHHSPLRHLELQFLDSVSLPVYTGKEIKGEGGSSIRVALADADGNPVTSGSEASAKLEIMVLPDGAEDDYNSLTCGESSSMVSAKKGRTPLLSRNYLKLKGGVAVLDKFKFKNKSKWTKSCEVKLVARVVEDLNGTTVKEAKTESFLVMDCRCTFYKKHYPPLLSDDIWRLEKISRGGRLHKRMREAKINSVKEFLISLNTDPQSLQQRLGVSAEKFKVIVDHAQTCVIGGNQYLYNSPDCERKFAVVFNVVGCLQGLLREQRFVPVNDLAIDEKAEAHKMVVSAFEHWEDVQSNDIEAPIADLQSQSFSRTTISPRTGSPSDCNSGICKTIDGIDRALSRSSSQHMSPIYSLGSASCFDGFGFLQMDNLDFLSPGINYCDHSRNTYADFGDNEHLQLFVFNHDDNLELANARIEAHNVQSSAAIGNEGAAAHVASSIKARLRWKMAAVSVRKRIMVPEATHAQKKQRQC